MLPFVFLVCVGVCSAAVTIPHGHELKVLVDKGFALLDANGDGYATMNEVQAVNAVEDLNNDGKISLAEYAAYWKRPEEELRPMFNAYDTDLDGYITGSQLHRYFDTIDSNHDGNISLHEYEHYMTGVVQCVYAAHGNHGHGHDCHN